MFTIDPPDAYNYAMYANQAAASSRMEINYVFAQQMRILREPQSGALKVTMDAQVSAGLERHGYELVVWDEVRSLAEMEPYATIPRVFAGKLALHWIH